MDKNSYFKVIDGDASVSMKIFPPEGGGEVLKIEEVTGFLEKMGIRDYDLVKVNQLLSSGEEKEERISLNGCYRFDESVSIKVTADRMLAVARFYPPSSRGSRMDREELIRAIKQNRITFGIDEAVVDSFISNPVYCTNYVIAKGKKTVDGHDASITYHFQTDRRAKPQLKEDGTVDFHNLNNISNVKKGDVLATLTKEDVGVSGTDVFGHEVKPRKVNRLSFKYGNGIKVSEDGLKLISDVDGHAILEKDKVFVSNNYDVPADVDNSTGDIDYKGSVTVKGNVRTGFSVQAEGDVEVFGVVEGCKISAGGDIIIHRGIQGMGRSDIKAKGNLISRFIEGADIEVGGYVETDTIINSNVAAEGDIYVRGKNASLIGGNVRSATLIEAANIGSPMGAATNVEVGTDPALRDRINKLKENIESKTKENEKLSQILEVMRKKRDMGILEKEKAPMLGQLTKNIVLNSSEIKAAVAEMQEAEKLLSGNANARIRATKSIFPGTRVTVAGEYITVRKETVHCEFKKVNSEVRSAPLL